MHDPGAQSATAPNPPVVPGATVHGAPAKPADAGARRLRANTHGTVNSPITWSRTPWRAVPVNT
jgi:hypothetical protein